MANNIPYSARGGGEFKHLFVNGITQINTGATGLLFTLTPPSGQRVRLESLAATNNSQTVGSITVEVGGVTIVNALTLTATSPSNGQFSVGIPSAQNGTNPGAIQNITGATDEVIEVTAVGATGANLFYQYSFGV